ncbi:hypothetical protein EBQ93_00285, partial [bacterium]|nr:hypothetical protein [bacterium]
IFERSFFNVRTVAEFDGLDQVADDLDFLLEEGSLSQEPFTSATQVESDITTSQKIMFAYALFMLKSQEFIEKSIKESVKWFDSVMDL